MKLLAFKKKEKKKYVTCSPFKLIMGYEYTIKEDRQIYNKQFQNIK